MLEKKIKKLKVGWLGEDDWKRMRDFLVIKFREADTEEKFNRILEVLIGSMFTGIGELNEARKKIGKEMLSEIEQRKLKELGVKE